MTPPDLPQPRIGQIWQCRSQGIRAKLRVVHTNGTMEGRIKLVSDDTFDGLYGWSVLRKGCWKFTTYEGDRYHGYDLMTLLYDPTSDPTGA